MGTIMLKFKRPSLPREVTVGYKTAIFGTTCVSLKVDNINKKNIPSLCSTGIHMLPKVYGERARVCLSVEHFATRFAWIVLFHYHSVHWLPSCSFCSIIVA